MKDLCAINGCSSRVRTRGYCSRHYSRWLSHGDPNGGGTRRGEPLDYFVSVVMKHDGGECLIWPYARSSYGYGQVYLSGSMHNVHRLVCESVNGAPPPGMYAAHECGNGHLGCVNRHHVSWKSPTENNADKIKHGTQIRGEQVAVSKLSDDLVQQIHDMRGTLTQKQIARRFNVSQSTICRIHRRQIWTHVSGAMEALR